MVCEQTQKRNRIHANYLADIWITDLFPENSNDLQVASQLKRKQLNPSSFVFWKVY